MADSVARGTLTNLLTRVVSVAAVLAITALVARRGTEVQGAFALFTGVEGVLLALFSGFGVALARRVSHHREEPRALVSAVIGTCVALGVVAGLALWVASYLLPPAYAPLWLLALVAPLLLLAPNLAGLWLGEGRMAPLAVLNVAPSLLALMALLLIALWWPTAALLAVLVAWVGAKVLVSLALVGVLWRRRRLARLSGAGVAALRAELPFVARIGVTNLIGLLNYRVGLFVVERVLGLAATGVYSIAVVVAELLWFLSSSLTQAVYGRIGTPDRAAAAATTVRAVQLSLAGLLVAAPLLWFVAAAVLPRLLGPAYAASLWPLALLLPGVLVFGGASALSAYFTNHGGQPEVPARVAALSLVANGLLCVLFVPRWGMAGAALAASLSYGVSVAVLARLFVRHAGLPLAALLQPGPQLWADLRAVASLAAMARSR
jgi:O-antigen/teichoic acid export membrane protein